MKVMFCSAFVVDCEDEDEASRLALIADKALQENLAGVLNEGVEREALNRVFEVYPVMISFQKSL